MKLIHDIQVATRDLGYGSDEYHGPAYVTGEYLWTGAQVILIEAGYQEYRSWYLFEDEWEIITYPEG